jgi:hypothetical protein
MDDDKIKHFIKTFSEQFVKLAGQVLELRASVNVLKLTEATRLSPGDPLEGLKLLQELEKKLLDSDPNEKQRKEVSEMMEAVKLWERAGGGQNEA